MSCEKPIDPICPCGKCPEPDIPFVPPNPPDCDDGTECVELYDGACVKYSGTNMACLGVTTGMTLNTVVQTIAGYLCACAAAETQKFITLTVSDIDVLKTKLGITDITNPAQWITGFNNYWGSPTKAAFTSVISSGNVVTLYGGLDIIEVIPLFQVGLIAFDTTHGLPKLTTLDLDNNPEYLDFNTSVPLTSTTINTYFLHDCGFTIFNPRYILPESPSVLLLARNNITDFNIRHITTSMEEIDLRENALIVTSVNAILEECDAKEWGTGKSILLTGGTNAAPTGGGIGAKNNLIARGVTVTTN